MLIGATRSAHPFCPCLSDADWCLQSAIMATSRLQDMERIDKKYIIRHLDLSEGFSDYDASTAPTPDSNLRQRGKPLTLNVANI